MRLRVTIFLVCLCSLLLAGDQWGRPDDRPAWGRGRFGQGDVAAADDWLPSEITNVNYWWRADSGVTYGSAAPACTSWTDIIGDVVIYADAAANEPSYYTGVDGINGQPVIQGGGTDDSMWGDIPDINQPYSIWCVATVPTDNAGARALVNTKTTAALTGIYNSMNLANNPYSLSFGTAVNGGTSTPFDVVFYLAISEDSTDVDRLWVNGTRVVSGNCGTGALTTVMLMRRNTGAFTDAKIAEVGIVTGKISDADEVLLAAYVQTRYGLAAW